jgi:anaerobic dimethyl sulfoxide reductase subunit A
MTGNVGVLGGEVSCGSSASRSHLGTPGGSAYVSFGSAGYTYPKNAICTEPRGGSQIQNGQFNPEQEYGITFAETFKAVAEGEYTLPGPAKEKRACDIRCIYRENAHQPATQQSGVNWVEKAFRKSTVEFVLVQDQFFTVDAQYADIVLPVTTTVEEDISVNSFGSIVTAEFALLAQKVIEPYFESKADPVIYFMLCDKLGLGEDVAPRLSIKQCEFNKILKATVVKESGTEREPLITVTQADLDALGVTGEPVEGRIPLKEIMDTGAYQVERKDGDNLMNCFDKAFAEDPEANPVGTASGKYEIYCQTLKDYYDFACFNDIDALPKYKAAPLGYEQTKTDPEFPFQFLTLHVIRQAHSNYSSIKQLNEVFPNDLLMSEYDAEKLGFKKGDWVVVSNKEGSKMARRLNVIPNLIPGVIALGEGNWRDINKETGIDEGGNANQVVPGQLLGDGYQSYNSSLLKVEAYSGSELLPDYRRPPRVPLVD